MLTKKLIFICTGNTCRSPMAEGFFRALDGENRTEFLVSSAGTFTPEGLAPSKNAIITAHELGAEISAHRSRNLTQQMVEEATLLVCVTVAHAQRVAANFPQAISKIRILTPDVQDPFGGNLQCYRETAQEIYHAVEKLIIELENEKT